MVSVPPRLGILLSGRGSNFLALRAAIERGDVPAQIALVVSNEPSSVGLLRARELGLETVAIPHRAVGSRKDHERAVLDALNEARVDWICLAGYLRLLSPVFLERYPQRVLNIHPSLLPAFPGLEAQRQALEYGARFSGCTVHLVDAGLDSGPIVDQRVVPILPGDTVDQLSERILEHEHELYPVALRQLLTRAWKVDGRRLTFLAPSESSSLDH